MVRDDARGATQMTRRSLLPIGGIAALMAAGLARPAAAQSSTRPEETTTTTKEKAHNIPDSQLRKVTVTVRDVDPSQHTVVFTAHVSPEAAVMNEGQRIRIDELKPGDEIRASFDPKTGEVMKVEKVKQGTNPSK
jgi:hypothetical protein